MKSKEQIIISTIDPTNKVLLGNIASLYVDVFAGQPWNEVSKRIKSGSFYGKDVPAGSLCPDCANPLVEAYPKEETLSYILGELGKTNPIGLLAYVNNELAGFSWGYETSVDQLIAAKWKTQKMQNKVKDLLAKYGVGNELFYGSETAVDPLYHGKGLGKRLIRARLAQVNNTGINYMVIRTNYNSPMYGICKSLGGWVKDIGEFSQIFGPVAKKRFFAKSYEPAYEYVNGIDTENPDSVLFLYDKKAYDSRFDGSKRDYMFGDGMH